LRGGTFGFLSKEERPRKGSASKKSAASQKGRRTVRFAEKGVSAAFSRQKVGPASRAEKRKGPQKKEDNFTSAIGESSKGRWAATPLHKEKRKGRGEKDPGDGIAASFSVYFEKGERGGGRSSSFSLEKGCLVFNSRAGGGGGKEGKEGGKTA